MIVRQGRNLKTTNVSIDRLKGQLANLINTNVRLVINFGFGVYFIPKSCVVFNLRG